MVRSALLRDTFYIALEDHLDADVIIDALWRHLQRLRRRHDYPLRNKAG